MCFRKETCSQLPFALAPVRILRQLHLYAAPVLHGGKRYFQIRPQFDTLEGNVWLNFGTPYIQNERGQDYLMEATFWIGSQIDQTKQMELCRGAKNKDKALHLNWPHRRGLDEQRRYHQAIVSRAMGFSLLFKQEEWPGCKPYDHQIIVHHADEVHQNNFLGNLQLEWSPDHTAMHNRKRRKH